jgi:hypothetical protein
MNMKNASRNRSRRGGGLVAVLVVTLSISGLLAGVMAGSLQRAFMAKRLADRIRAKAIAERGVSTTYAALASDFDLRTNENAFTETEYAGGSVDVDVTPIGDDSAVINSTATYGSATEVAMLDVRIYGGNDVGSGGAAYGCAILADGEISWTGCGVFFGDSLVHANNAFVQAGSGELNAKVSSSVSVVLKGNSGAINGDVVAPEVSGKTSKVSGTITEQAVDEIPIPEIDLAPYYNEALANGQVYEGNRTLSSGFAPPGGIMWVNGDLTVSGPDDIEGCFIATGNIHCSGSGGHSKVAGYPAFVSRDGDIKFSGSGRYEGLVYTRVGDVEVVGSGTLEGSVICGGDFKKAGVSTIFNYERSVPVAPNALPSDGVLCVSAWQK